jgi:hypothetical protein
MLAHENRAPQQRTATVLVFKDSKTDDGLNQQDATPPPPPPTVSCSKENKQTERIAFFFSTLDTPKREKALQQ